MLGRIKRRINKAKKSNITFDELFVDYLLYIQDINIEAEMEYIKNHNKIDIFKIDKWLEHTLQEVIK